MSNQIAREASPGVGKVHNAFSMSSHSDFRGVRNLQLLRSLDYQPHTLPSMGMQNGLSKYGYQHILVKQVEAQVRSTIRGHTPDTAVVQPFLQQAGFLPVSGPVAFLITGSDIDLACSMNKALTFCTTEQGKAIAPTGRGRVGGPSTHWMCTHRNKAAGIVAIHHSVI